MNPKDKIQFDNLNKDIIKQYELAASYDGIKFDASLSTGEDAADWVGALIATTYLRDFQENNRDPMPIRRKSFEAFFNYFAIQARQIIQRKAIKINLETNPHPLEKYRTNCVLARLRIYSMLYDIKKGDRMYWKFRYFW
jgi:predicted metalloendopeptidase